jgi:hypothetical protein
MHEKALQKQDESIKELKTLSGTNDPEIYPEIYKSSFSDLFFNFIDTYRGFMDVLSSEQLVIFLIFSDI